MDIVFCASNSYVMPCGITIISLLESNQSEEIVIHVVSLELNEISKNILKEISDKYNAKILFFILDEEYLNGHQLPSSGGGHISISTYLRLFLPDIIPSHIEKILYLDCDLMILDSIKELWNTNIENYSSAGAIDFPTFMPKTYQDLKFSEKYPYINAGALLINLKYWRDNNIIDKFLKYSNSNNENIHRKDQDIINGVLYDSILLFPIRYNLHNFFFWRDCNAYKYQKEVEESLKNPVIIHFTTSLKPWLKGSVHPMTKRYLEYKKNSPWRDTSITWGNLTLKRKMRFYKRFILSYLGLKEHKFIKM